MKAIALGLVAMLALLGAGTNVAESGCEPLEIARPHAPVVQPIQARQLVAAVNAVRQDNGLPDVIIDGSLAQVALAYARDMAARKFFGHFSPEGASLPDRLRALGVSWQVAAENIALDADVNHANAALLNSPTHRANILDPRVRKIGVAVLAVGAGAALYVEDFSL